METEKKFYVYVDYRGDDGKPFYVGKGITRRIKDLQRNPLHTNIKNKHGMVRKILFENLSESESFEKEIQLIQELRTHIDFREGGANLTFGGEGVSGYKYTKEQRKKKSESLKKRWEDPGYREKMSESVSETNKKSWEDPEYREKMYESLKNVWEDPERREKMSESNKKNWEDPGYREKMSKSVKKQWEDPEHRKNISESQKKRWEDPEYRAMMKEKIKLGKQKKKLEKFQQKG